MVDAKAYEGFSNSEFQIGDSAEVYYHQDSTSPKEVVSINCTLGGADELYGRGGLVDYLIGGSFDDYLEGNDGPDLVFGDHARITFFETSHQLRFATTTHPGCAGGMDTIDLGSGDDIAFGGANSDIITGKPFRKICELCSNEGVAQACCLLVIQLAQAKTLSLVILARMMLRRSSFHTKTTVVILILHSLPAKIGCKDLCHHFDL